ncbi:MAG TPA: hypothetical protein VMY88_04700 [Acidimicrobiales bacterium]|nr:hypothetical protein [Acidimicrobiales bacterium]
MALSARATPRSTWGHDRLPLVTSMLAAVALLSILPSALNIPQSTPSETLEYAPVPPEDQNEVTPPSGNFSSLGLGSSSGLTSEALADAGDLGGGEVGGRAIKTPSTKRCVGRPPRQTEDPAAPPCVASFNGDNGGNTYPGVTADEIRVLFYWGHGNANYLGSRGQQTPAENAFYDLAQPPGEDDPYTVEAMRVWQRYFNERFQTYGRFVHFWVHFGRGGGQSISSPETRAADAAEGYSRVKPFAVVVNDVDEVDSYIAPMARRGVMTFGAGSGLVSIDSYRTYPGLVWGYNQPMEFLVDGFTNLLCQQVVNRPVSDSGDPAYQGRPRKMAFLTLVPDDSEIDDKAAARIKSDVAECGGSFAMERNFAFKGSIWQSPHDADAYTAMVAELKSNEITTVIWNLYYDKEWSEAAKRAAYFPESIVLTGNGYENIVHGKWMDQDVWDHAWVFTPKAAIGAWVDTQCFKALREAAPDLPYQDTSIPCRFYEDLRQLFTGIQVAGPKVTPESVDKGFHAIPAHPSSSADSPACFYLPNDYSCVKDNALWQWDRNAVSDYSSAPGCYRMVNAAERHLVGKWPQRDITAAAKPDDPCSGFNTGGALDPSPSQGAPPNQ